MGEWIWYGVFDDKGVLVDCSPGPFHASTVAKDLTTKTKREHTYCLVVITIQNKEP